MSGFVQLCIRIYRKFDRHSLVSKVYDRVLWLGVRKKFQNKSSQMAGKRYREIKVCKSSVIGESFCSSLK